MLLTAEMLVARKAVQWGRLAERMAEMMVEAMANKLEQRTDLMTAAMSAAMWADYWVVRKAVHRREIKILKYKMSKLSSL